MEISKLLVFVFFIKGLDAYETKGIITSPGYPGNYPKNCNVTWMIEAPLNANNISIIIEDQDIHKTIGFDCDDFLQIEEYESQFTMYKQCGNGSTRSFIAKGRKVLVSFMMMIPILLEDLNCNVASYKEMVYTSKNTVPVTIPKGLTTVAQSVPISIRIISQQTSTITTSSPLLQRKRSQTVSHSTKDLSYLTTARDRTLVKESDFKKFSNLKPMKMVIIRNSTPTSANPPQLINGSNNPECNTSQTIKDNNVISAKSTEYSTIPTVVTEQRSQPNHIQSTRHNHTKKNTNPWTIFTTKSTFNPILWEEKTLTLSTNTMNASDKTENTRMKEKSNLASSAVRETDQTHQNPSDQTQSEVLSTLNDKKTTIQSSTTEIKIKKEMSSSHLNSFLPVLLSVCGFLFFLLFIFLFIVFVQRRKIKRLQEEPHLSYLHNNQRYSTILQMEHRPIEGNHIYDRAGRVLPSRKENDYKYLSPESFPKHKKSLKINRPQDRVSKRYFCPAELSEIQEKTNYIEILPDASAVYYEPASSFESTAIYAQSAKRRPYSTIDEVQQNLDISEYESLDLSKTSSESYNSGKGARDDTNIRFEEKET